MRRAHCPLPLVLLAAFSIAPNCGADDRSGNAFPLQARVVTAGAAVRSGPAETYYLTDTLPEDSTVEVYRRQPDGWCAIRPPQSSFSWIYAQHVQPADDGLARINKDDVPVRVGSRLSARRNVVQVRLHNGEMVEILGQDDREGGPWYKIAPPAGEFRWVNARDLAPIGSGDATWEPAAAIVTVSLEQPVESKADGEPEELTAPPLASDSAGTWAATDDSKASAAASSPSSDVTPLGPSTSSPQSAASPDFASELALLELRLSRMVAEPTETWNVDTLEQAAERLLSQADTVADRDAVKATLAKIDRFATIQRRHLAIHGGTVRGNMDGIAADADGPTARPQIAAGIPVAAAAETAGGGPAGRFDAVGVLRPVVSRRPGAPQFALVNEQGQVVTFLTPTPDVNLQPYLGRRIGVVGSRGYIPEFRRAHVTAGRVTPLADRVLR